MIIKDTKIMFSQGDESNLPTLMHGEPAVTTNTEKFFIGINNKNEEVALKKDICLTIKDKTIIENTLTLGIEPLQYADIISGTTIVLPVVSIYTEINLFFECINDIAVTFPSISWQQPTETKANKKYKYNFIWVNNDIGWVGSFTIYA